MKPSKQKGIAVIVFLLLLLVGCAKDTEAPIITKVTVEESTMSIEATDNQKVVGYLLKEIDVPAEYVTLDWHEREDLIPTLKTVPEDKDTWQESNTFADISDGLYFVWVKDKAGNLTSYEDQVIISNDYESKFELMRWAEKEIDPELKQKYGSGYAMVEPLSHEEIEKRFEFLAWWSVELIRLYEMPLFLAYGHTGLVDAADDAYLIEPYDEFDSNMYNLIYNQNDPLVSRFMSYYKISPVTGTPTTKWPEDLLSRNGVLGIDNENSRNAKFEDKEFVVRYTLGRLDLEIKTWKDMGYEIQYFFQTPEYYYVVSSLEK